MPKVTVLMPVYNGEKYLKEAIDSILNQTFSDFEFLIINDGSTDNTVGIINSYNDSRIRLVHNDKNLGLITTLNKGFDLARGEYIARMDCDDVSLPDRLSKQVVFMEAHPGIGVCGTWFEFMDCGQVIKWPEQHDAIKAQLFYNTALGHPTVMMRTDVIKRYEFYYDSLYEHSEDYELWIRLSEVTQLSNIPEILLKYRIHPDQISVVSSGNQQSIVNLIRKNQVEEFHLSPTKEDIQLHLSIVSNKIIDDCMIPDADIWLRKLKSANVVMKIYNEKRFNEMLANLWLNIFANKLNLSFLDVMRFLRSPLRKYSGINFKRKIDLTKKCLQKLIKKTKCVLK